MGGNNSKTKRPSAWTLVYEGFKPAEENLREAICTLGNGYMASRGAAYEMMASKIHYPGTYIGGVYNRLPTHISGKTIVNEDLVNCPNWAFMTFKIGNGEWFSLSSSKILSYRQELDMRRGVLSRRVRFQNRTGQRTVITTRKIVSMDNCHIGALEYIVTPENYDSTVTFRTMLDGSVINSGVERYKQLNSKHLRAVSIGNFDTNGLYLTMRTSQSHIEISEAAKINCFQGRRRLRPRIKYLMKGRERIGIEFKVPLKRQKPCTIEKVVAVFTSRDGDSDDPYKSSVDAVKKAGRFEKLMDAHTEAWSDLWNVFDIQIDGHLFSQRVIRLHSFHLLQTASEHSVGKDVGFPARGLHGEAYRGHIFWDEMFAMPFYDLRQPDVSEAMIKYRYNRLGMARRLARKAGYRGSMYPWQSGSSGREESQVVHLNPLSGEWGPDYSQIQRHVSFAIGYNVWQHWYRTEDLDFLINYGAEMLISIAQFGASLTKFNKKDGKYHTSGIMGPDEFHEKYHNSKDPGLTDNAYTNVLIVWILMKAKEVLDILPVDVRRSLIKKLRVSTEDFMRWNDIINNMNVIINEDDIIAQFKDYFKLKELDWEGYRAEYDDIHRMDRILKAEGKSPDEYKVAKQADALMIFYLFRPGEVDDIFRNMGYAFKKKMLKKNYGYYIKRTSHGSTLSLVVHCYLALLLNKPREVWEWFIRVLRSDIYDVQGGTTPEGIHTGVMGGSIDIVFRGFLGLKIDSTKVSLNPRLPEKWERVKFKIVFRGRVISFSVSHKKVTVNIQEEMIKPITVPVEIQGKIHKFIVGKPHTVVLE